MYYYGVDIGGMSIKFGIVDDKGNLVSKKVVALDYKKDNVSQIVEMMKEKLESLCQQAKIGKNEIKGLGFGCPGACDAENGILLNANNLGWSNVNLRELFKDMRLPVFIDNDANAALIGEKMFGAAKPYKDCLILTIGTGLGGGIMINNQMYYGNEGKAAELGHMCIEMNGRQCSCGHKGCWEPYVSATALMKDTKAAMEANKDSYMWEFCDGKLDNVNGKTAFEVAYNTEDKAAKEVVKNFTYYLAEGIRSYCNIFRPEAIIIGGGVSAQKERLTGPIIKQLEEWDWGQKASPKVEILTSELGNDAGIIGAACLAMK